MSNRRFVQAAAWSTVTGTRPYRSIKVVVMIVVTAYVLWAAIEPSRVDLLHLVSLRLYRTGQFVFAPLGSDLAAVRGLLAQIFLPAALSLVLILVRARFAAALSLMWLAQNLFVASAYLSDASERRLPTVGPVDPALDWQRLLEHWGWLGTDHALGQGIHFAGFCIFVFATLRGFQVSLWETRHF